MYDIKLYFFIDKNVYFKNMLTKSLPKLIESLQFSLILFTT